LRPKNTERLKALGLGKGSPTIVGAAGPFLLFEKNRELWHFVFAGAQIEAIILPGLAMPVPAKAEKFCPLDPTGFL
jgi:hypothetical protein